MSGLERLAGTAGSLLAALAVAGGAFGAHALRATLDPAALALWQTAVLYQFFHALGLLAVAGALRGRQGPAAKTACLAFLIGIPLFSGSLYALALGAPHGIGALTPIGGGAFLIGWIALAASFLRRIDR